MAIVEKGQGVNVGETEIPDNQVAIKISSTDSKDYIIIDTTNDHETINIGSGADTSDVCHVSIGSAPGSIGEILRVRQNHTSDSLVLFENTGSGIALDLQSNRSSGDVVTLKNNSGGIFASFDADHALKLNNPTHENTDGGRESTVRFSGEKSDGTAHDLARIESRHDGSADDTKGEFAISTNTGSGLQEQLLIDSSGILGARRFAGIVGVQSDVYLQGAGAGGDVKINNGDGRDVIIYNGSSTLVMKVDADVERVGISEDTPECALHITGGSSGLSSLRGGTNLLIEDSDENGIFLRSAASKEQHIYFANSSENANAGMQFQGSANRLNLLANAVTIASLHGGNFGVGATSPVHKLQVQDGDAAIVTNSADEEAKSLIFIKSRHATDGEHAVVQNNDVLGEIKFQGSDGNSFEGGASIKSRVDGTPADGKMPGDLVFSTSPDTTTGGHTLGDMVERLTIDDLGQINVFSDTAGLVQLNRYLVGSATNYGSIRTYSNGFQFQSTQGGNSSVISMGFNWTDRYTFTNSDGFHILNGYAAPSSSVANGVKLYSEDVNQDPGSGAADYAELKVRDEIGNITTLSPHNFSVTERSDPMAWSHYSKNPFVGKEINVDMMAVIKAVEQLSGQTFIQERNLDPSECRDWDTEEQARVAKSQEAIDEWEQNTDEDKIKIPRPELYVAQPKPDWMN